MTTAKTRDRFAYALLIAVTILLGLTSRKFSAFLPIWLAKNAGDALYAVMAFWLVGFVAPRLSTLRSVFVALLFCAGIEFLKFSQDPRLIAARHSRAGALVFGRGFHASNLVCYGIGVLLAALIERLLSRALRR